MEENRIFIAGDRIVYRRVPEKHENQELTVTLVLPQGLAGKYLKLEVMPEDVSDIPVKCKCKESECENCHVVNCMVHYDNAVLHDVNVPQSQEKVDVRPTIPGHPNGQYGECYDCRVVSCSIQQGWAPIPEL